MSSRSRPGARATSEETRNQIKAAAQMLFARRGVDGVTVQEIVTAAGQRNNAALHYHFGSKEELIRQMVVDGAAVLDRRRREMLDEIEARGGPKSTRRRRALARLYPLHLEPAGVQPQDAARRAQQPLELGICRLLQLSEADAAAAGGNHRATPVDVRDLRQLDPVSARSRAGVP